MSKSSYDPTVLSQCSLRVALLCMSSLPGTFSSLLLVILVWQDPFPCCGLRGPESTLCLMQASLLGFTQIIWKKESTNGRFTTFPFVESSSIPPFRDVVYHDV